VVANLARPASRRAQRADLAEVVRLYGLRNWVEQGDKQVKGELGWADLQVPSDRAICRHWTLVAARCRFVGRHGLPTTLGNRQRPTRRPSRRPRGGNGDQTSAPNQPSGARGRWRCGRCGPG
jgi:hypothetical protein